MSENSVDLGDQEPPPERKQQPDDSHSASVKKAETKKTPAKKAGAKNPRTKKAASRKTTAKAAKKVASKKTAVKKIRSKSASGREKAVEQTVSQATPDPAQMPLDYNDDDFSEERRTDLVDGLGALIGGVRSLSNSAFKLAKNKTLDSAAKMIQQSPEQLERMAGAGRSLRDLRNVAGVSVEELAGAIDLKNPDLLKSVEEGKAALPFEILLRLSSFYARNNPVPFILKYARTYSPLISRTLEKIGIDKLVIEAEREIQFVQILRSRDAARALSDEEFERVHAFTERAFDMALHFAANEVVAREPEGKLTDSD